MNAMKIRELFDDDVTRDIPPVVYFHEQSPAKLHQEVSQYIITGGWPDGHPNHKRVPTGIHEQYVRLLSTIAAELGQPGGPSLPASWISGFYGSGKSSFAKLLGLALDGVILPDGTELAEALLRRDTSPRAAELRAAWRGLREQIDPIAVVFDIGGVARDNEHIHAAVVRQVQKRLGYCSTESLVAEFELKLERDGQWQRFEDIARQTLGRPWAEVKDRSLAEEDFSLVMFAMFPDKYTDPMSWFTSRAGTFTRADSAEEATRAIADMLRFRAPDKTLFLVVDEVSQYVHQDTQRMLALQSFVSELGQRLKGRVWLLATGQEKLEDVGDAKDLFKLKDRFPPKLRVHIAHTNIRDVVSKRLLHKTPAADAHLRELFHRHRNDLKLFAYGCDSITEEDFAEVYPLLPGHIDLLLQITSALRMRSSRSQGDDQTIRGLLQLLGELFRERKLADKDVGSLVTLDEIYEVQQTALDSDVQSSMARILGQCADDASELMVRAAKAVALLELVQENLPTDARLVAACLYDRLDRGSRIAEITEALEELRRRNLLGYSEKHGYKIQSSAGEEWERERRDISVAREQRSDLVQDALKYLLADKLEKPLLSSRGFPWSGYFSDGRRADDVQLQGARDAAAVVVDFRFVLASEQIPATWIKRSDESALRNRLIWVCGDPDPVDQLAYELGRSQAMVKRFQPRRDSLTSARKLLLQQEENRLEDLAGRVRAAVASTWLSGCMYFRGRELAPRDLGSTFAQALHAAGTRILPELFPHFDSTTVEPRELAQLLESELSGPSPKFLPDGLGILELDAGRYVPACSGMVPRRVLEHIDTEGGLGGASLLSHFSGPPYGYTPELVRACVAGLLRASKLRIQTEDGSEITAMRDAGVRELFDKDRAFKRATIFPAGEDDVGFQARARICKFFDEHLGHRMDREDHLIADAVAALFPAQARRLREVLARLDELPDRRPTPMPLAKLESALEDCIRTMRQTKPTVRMVKKHLDTLRDGIHLLKMYATELSPEAIQDVRAAAEVRDHHLAQLEAARGASASAGSGVGLDARVAEAGARIRRQLESERPWRDIVAIKPDMDSVRAAYVAERTRLLAWQEEMAELARARIKARSGFAGLSSDDAHTVLRPIALAVMATSADAVAPPLELMRDPFEMGLRRAVDRANELFDEIVSEGGGGRVPIVRLELGLRNREIHTREQLEALLDEIRRRVEPELASGARIRLL